jgi:hyaluronan synthase
VIVTVAPATLICGVIIWLYVTSRHSAKALGFYYMTAYGCIALLNYVTQFMFAFLDRKHIDRIVPQRDHDLTVAVQVAGWREDAGYFENCLKSVRDLDYDLLSRALVVVDGDDTEDQYMGEIAVKVFGNSCKVIHLPNRMDPGSPRRNEMMMKSLIDPFMHHRVLCILQPHGGKRHAIYTATRITMRYGYDCLFNTDSDTVLRSDCISRMVDVLHAEADVAAVAGALEIFNAHESLLARMSHARYFHAFNLERAAQSFHGCVQCISGPCGMYRTAVVATVLDAWMNQSFLGKPCAAGDDRHMTSCILGTGNRIKFTHLAIASTETPITYLRWLNQQTRWMKSALREGGYSLMHVLSKQSWYATFELSYHTLIPLALIATIVLLVYHKHTVWSVLGIVITTTTIPCIRALACYWTMERRPDLFFISLYSLYYITSLLPAKLYALVTLTDVAWGTSVRKAGSMRDKCCDGVLVAVLLWNAAVLFGLIYEVRHD